MKKEQKKNSGLRQIPRTADPAVHEEVISYAERLVDPEGSNAALSPSPLPVRSLPIKQILNKDFKNEYKNNEIYGEIVPSCSGILSLTTTQTDVATNSPISFDASTTPAGNLSSGVMRNVIEQNLFAHEFMGGGTSNVWQFEAAGSGTILVGELTCNIEVSSGWQGALVGCRGVVLDSIGFKVTLFTIADIVPGKARSATNTVSWNVGLNPYLQFEFFGGGDNMEFDIDGSLSSAGNGLYLAGSAVNQVSYDLDVVADVNLMERSRITSLGMLGTYMGSDLQNGGRIACARVSRDWTPGTNILESIAEVPNDRYDGPLKDGFHMHFQPLSLQELEFREGAGGGTLAYPFKYVFLVHADDVTQSFRLSLTAHAEYYSTSSSYGAMNFGPPAQGITIVLDYLARTIPCATSNDHHLIEKALKLIKSGSRMGLNYVMENPQVLSTLAGLL